MKPYYCSRRGLSALALLAGLFALAAIRARAADTPLVGAIRWDAWQDSGGQEQAAVEQTLGPNHWHFRLPYFAQVTSSNTVAIDGNSAALMDQEIAYAANAGINYWAFDVYPDYYPMSDALHLYLNSPRKNRINFALILQSGQINFDTNTWAVQVSRFVGYFQDPAYQKVLGNRPLVYLLGALDGTALFPTVADASNAVSQLRTATTNAGLGNPYIVFQGFYAPDDYTNLQNYQLDALGSYAVSGGTTSGAPYLTLAAQAHAFWEADRATGANVVPIVTTGWDNRPRAENPISWDMGSWDYFVGPTPAELAGHLTDALDWTTNYLGSATPANTVLIYAWNEHDEGGWLCPTLNTNSGAPDLTRLAAIRGVLPPASSAVSLLANASFETPPVSNGWYVVPAGGMPDAFGWSNNFDAGQYVIADSQAEHFTAAADGDQALLLVPGYYLSQDTGLTAPDTLYVLTFDLLQDDYAPDPGGAVRAEIYDGTNLLAGGDFPVPFPADLWQMFALDCVSPHTPAGDLAVKFSGVSGTAWLDDTSLIARSLPVELLLTNASFETPTNVPWYVVPAGGMPPTFGWSNNFTAGSYVLADQYSAHFSGAADGSQALLLAPGLSISQAVGLADTNCVYWLTFSLLQDDYTPVPNSAVNAEIFVGTNLLASNSFTVPAIPDTWGEFTLTLTPYVTGEITIQFTGLSGTPWLDKVQLMQMPRQPRPWHPPANVTGTLGGGQFLLTFIGDSGGVYYVQTSTNLTDWVSFPGVSPAAYPFTWTDYTASAVSSRFYRVQPGP